MVAANAARRPPPVAQRLPQDHGHAGPGDHRQQQRGPGEGNQVAADQSIHVAPEG
jgi:hypothetical protein